MFVSILYMPSNYLYKDSSRAPIPIGDRCVGWQRSSGVQQISARTSRNYISWVVERPGSHLDRLNLQEKRGSVLWRFQRDFEWSFSAYKTCASTLFYWYLWKHRHSCANCRTPARCFREYVAHSHPRWLGATCWLWNYKCKVVVGLAT